uniref:DUF1653 domain-containing protein n=1 Tax=Acetatifactor sp. TaxID=1872090 RepID=UPI0040561201
MSFIPKAHEIYKHFKGNLYQILAIAEHTETGESLVVYQAMYGDFQIYARPLEMFVSLVDKEKYPEVTQEFRFELQGPDSGRQREGMQEAKVWDTVKVTETSAKPESTIGKEMEVVCESEDEPNLDPLVLEFLDADSYEQRLNILAGLHHRITDEMITTMAIACDVEVEDGDTENRYDSLKNCLLTLEKYECNRLR